MHNKLFFLLAALISMPLFAQTSKDIEPTSIECQYQVVQQKDTIQHNKISEDRIILRIGKNVSQSFNYNRFFSDSLNSTPNGRKQWGEMMIRNIKKRQYNNMPLAHTMVSEYVYKNYPKGKMTCTDVFLTSGYQYEEDMPTQQWQPLDSIKQILGYTCQKAQCDFRGRHYIAWFTTDIKLGLSDLPTQASNYDMLEKF